MAATKRSPEEIDTLVAGLDGDPYDEPGMGMNAMPDCGFSPTMLALRDAGRAAEPRLLSSLAGAQPRKARSIVMVLGVVGGPASVQRLGQLLEQDGHEEVLEGTATALGRLGDPSAGPSLLRALSFTDKPRTRSEAARALGLLGATEARGPLTALLDDTTPRVKAAAFWSLKKLARPEAIPAMLAEIAQSRGQRKLLLIQLLGGAGKGSVPALQQILQRSAEPETRGAAAVMLARLVPDSLPAMSDLLAEALRSGDAVVFETLARPLVQGRYPAALPTLTAGRSATDERIRTVSGDLLESWK